MSDISNCTNDGVWIGTSIPIIYLCRCYLCYLNMSDCSRSFADTVDDFNVYIYV